MNAHNLLYIEYEYVNTYKLQKYFFTCPPLQFKSKNVISHERTVLLDSFVLVGVSSTIMWETGVRLPAERQEILINSYIIYNLRGRPRSILRRGSRSYFFSTCSQIQFKFKKLISYEESRNSRLYSIEYPRLSRGKLGFVGSHIGPFGSEVISMQEGVC